MIDVEVLVVAGDERRVKVKVEGCWVVQVMTISASRDSKSGSHSFVRDRISKR